MMSRTRKNIAAWFVDTFALDRPHSVALIEGDTSISAKQLQERMNRAGNLLGYLGCGRGDRVLIVLPDSSDLVAVVFGAAKVGAVPVPVSPFGDVADYAHYIRETRCRLIVAYNDVLEKVQAAVGGSLVRVMVVGGYGDHLSSWSRMLEQCSSDLNAFEVDPDSEGFWLFTSGSTTGQKAVRHSHNALTAASENIGQNVLRIAPEDRVLSVAKLSYAFGFSCGMCYPLHARAAAIVLREKPSLAGVASQVNLHRPTVVCGVSSFFDVLCRAAREWLEVDLSSIRMILCGGEPLPASLWTECNARGIDLVEALGSTEMLTHFISNRPGRARQGSCGTVVPGCEVQIRDEIGQPAARGVAGLLWARGTTQFIGYNESNPDPRDEDGWLPTGDTVRQDDDGYFYYIGRTDDMFKIAGLWSNPREVEAALSSHTAIRDAFVTSREDEHGRRRLVAYVVLREGANCTNGELLRTVAHQVPAHMLPAAFVRVTELPRTINGKINRTALPKPIWRR